MIGEVAPFVLVLAVVIELFATVVVTGVAANLRRGGAGNSCPSPR